MKNSPEYNRISYNGFAYMVPCDPFGVAFSPINELVELYEDYIHHRPNSATWEFRARVLKLAKDLFGSFSDWYAIQANMSMGEYQFKLIEETVRFITTGRRNMSIHTLAELVDTEEGVKVRPAKIPSTYDPIALLGVKGTADIISKWCQQPNGFIDMLCTLYVLFGHSRENYAQGY